MDTTILRRDTCPVKRGKQDGLSAVPDEPLVAPREKLVVPHAASLASFVARDGGLSVRGVAPLAALLAK
jgi:hypothetical protein